MKAKFKGGGIKGLVLEHGEKAVFALGVLCFLLFAYSLVGRETLPADKQPNKLLDAANEAKNSMESQQWDAVREGIAVVEYRSRARREDVVADNYALRVPFDRPIKEQKVKRTDPELFAVSSIRVASGMGAFALKSEKAAPAPAPAAAEPAVRKPSRGGKPPKVNLLEEEKPAADAGDGGAIDGDLPFDIGVKGAKDAKLSRQTWAVVTALVPYKKQFAEFERVFKDAIPVVENGANAASREAEKVRDTPVYAGLKFERAEIVGPDAAPPQWETVSFKQYVKLHNQWAVVAPEIVGQDYIDPVYTMPLGPLVAAEWDESVAHPPEVPLAAKEELEQNAKLASEQPAAEAQQMPIGVPGILPGAPQEAPQPAARPAAGKRVEKKIVEYRLVRIFDFDVEPGKTYQYRVRMILNNPNFGLADKFLKNVDSKKEKYRETAWSEPSPPVSIQAPDEIMFAGVQPAHGIKDTTIKVKLMTLDPDMGVPAVIEEDVPRGTVLNISKTVKVPDLINRKNVLHEVNFETDALLLDIRGGRAFSQRDKSLTEPGEALYSDRNGKLIAHNELDDLEQWEYYPSPDAAKPVVKPPKNKKDDNDLLKEKVHKKKKRRR